MPRARLDQALVERGFFASREKAQRAILAGQVRVGGHVARKPSDPIKPDDEVLLDTPERYVSRGGYKLEHGMSHFQVETSGITAIDLGASTGGFTDCLLQHGAALVYAVDVGRGQLDWKLRRDPRVVVMEKTNARSLTPRHFPKPFAGANLVVADCSFISLKMILPAAVTLLRGSGRILALVKPQFEAGKAEADKGAGVITDPAVHARVLRELEEFVGAKTGLYWRGQTPSPSAWPAGYKEFLVLLENGTP